MKSALRRVMYCPWICPWVIGGRLVSPGDNPPWPQNSVNGPAVVAVVARLGRSVSRSISECVVACCCSSDRDGNTVIERGAG